MKVKVQEAIVDLYTDILCHCYEPNGGNRLVVGTTTGRVVILEYLEVEDGGMPQAKVTLVAEGKLPGNLAVLGLHWSSNGIFIGARSLLYLLKTEDVDQLVDSQPLPFQRFECHYNVYDVCSQATLDDKVFGACDDAKIRAWDVSTLQQVCELADHRTSVEVCNANNEFLVSGSQDGKILVYEASLRTKKPVISFDVGKHVISGLDISQNSTWVAAGCNGSPTIYNLRNVANLPSIEVDKPQRIYTVHFDAQSNLWWAGGGNVVYRSANLTEISAKLRSTLMNKSIHHVYSLTSSSKKISAAGSATSVLFSKNGDYWEEMVHV